MQCVNEGRPLPNRWRTLSVLVILLAGMTVGVAASWAGASWEGAVGGLVLVFIALTMWPFVVSALRGRQDPFEARNAFAIVFALYTLPLPILTLLRVQPAGIPLIGANEIVQSLALSLAGLAFFYIGYGAQLGEAIARRVPLLAPESPNRLLLSTVLLSSMALANFGYFLIETGGFRAYLTAGYRLYELEQGREYLTVWMPLLSTAVLLFYYTVHQRRSRAWTTLFIAFAIGVSFLFTVVGRRRYLFTMLLAMLVYRHYAVRRFSLKQSVLLAMIGLTLMSVWGILRAIPTEQILTEQTWVALRGTSPERLFYAFTGSGEFSGAGTWIPEIMRSIAAGELSYLHGASYLWTPLILIPRLLFPDRPPVLSQWWVNRYHPDIAARGGGMGFFFLAEAYLNFGVIGVIMFMCLMGVVYRAVYSYLKQSKDDGRVALMYGAFISWIPTALRIDFATAFKGLVEFTIAILLLAFLYSNRWRLRAHP